MSWDVVYNRRAVVAPNSRDGLPVPAVLAALSGAPLYRTDRLGSVELVEAGLRFMPAH